MTDVPDTTHLLKLGDRYYYRRRIPKHLRAIIGRNFVKKALGVTTLAEARKLRAIEEVRTNALFAAAEKGLAGKGAGTAAQPLSMAMLTEHVREAVERLDRHAAQRLAQDPPETAEERAELREDAESNLAALRDGANPSTQIWVQQGAERIAQANGVSLGHPTAPLAEFFEVMRRGLLEVQRRKLDRLADDHSGRTHDQLFDRARPTSANFGQLCDLFVVEQMQGYEANGVSVKRADSVKAKVAIVREIVGESRPVHEIDDDVVSNVRLTLTRVPNNKTIIYKKLTLADAITRAEKDGKPTLGPKSQAALLDLLSAVLRLGVRKKLISGNPAQGARPVVKDKVAAADKRRPFSPEQIAKFFASPFYKSCAPNAPEPYLKPDRSWRFWTPIIAAFSGARLNEIVTLTVADFAVTKAGTHYFSVSDEGEGQSVKTETSRRNVPVHPELQRLGLLDFVEQRRKADGDKARLFPKLNPNQYGSFSWYPSRRFNEIWLPKEMGLEPKQSFHSFRHAVRDALRRSKASSDTLLHVCGWAPSGKAASDNYGSLNDPDLHAEAVAAIKYAGLDFGALYVKS